MEIKVVTITKASADGGLGVRLDGIQERDDNDVPQGYIHHVIHTVKPDGPVRQQGGLEVGDELLEVNGTSLIDLSHEKAVQVCEIRMLSFYLFVCTSTCLPVCLSVYLSMFVCLCNSLPTVFNLVFGGFR